MVEAAAFVEKQKQSDGWYRIDKAAGLSRADLIITVVSTFFGGILGWALSKVFDDPHKLELSITVVISTVAFAVCLTVTLFLGAFQSEGRDRLNSIEGSIAGLQDTVTKSVDGSAILVAREAIYPEMARCIREAAEQVVVLTYFMYDWESERRTFEPAVRGVAGVDEFYEAIYACIADPAVEYLRLWQVPAERIGEARDKILEDPRLAKEVQLIESIEPDHPEQCRMRIIPAATTASLVLVDRKTLFFNIDFFDSERGLWLSPFMLMMRDARGRAFSDMKRIIVKLTSRA